MRATTILRSIALLGIAAGFVLIVAANLLPTVALGGASLVTAPMIVAVAAAAALSCMQVRERGRSPRLMASGAAACLVAAVAWIVLIATSGLRSDAWNAGVDVAIAITAWAGAMLVVAGVTRYRSRHVGITILRGATIGAGAALMIAIMLSVWWREMINDFDELARKSIATLATVTLAGILANLVLTRLHAPGFEGAPEDEERVAMTVVCPRCAARQTITTGGDACGRCHLRIGVRLR